MIVAAGTDDSSEAKRLTCIVEMLYAGGVRVSELTGLRMEDLSLAEGRILVRGKGDKERLVPLGRMAVEALDAYLTRGRPSLAIRRAEGPHRRQPPGRRADYRTGRPSGPGNAVEQSELPAAGGIGHRR